METMLDRHLTPSQAAALPSEDDIAFYELHGWYVSDVVVPETVLDAAAAGVEQFYRGERDQPLLVAGQFRDWQADHDAKIRNNEFVSLQSRAIDSLVRQPIIGAIAARLARTDTIRLMDDQLVYKQAGDSSGRTSVGWHADHAYWGTCSSNNMLTAWIPFHDVDAARSPLLIIDGSHRWPDLEHTRHFNNTDLVALEEELRRRNSKVEKITIELRKGQISFHHCWTLHGSGPNRSDRPRLALAIHLQDADNRYQRCINSAGEEVHIADELLCRRLPNGDPDFHDPDVFPILWPT